MRGTYWPAAALPKAWRLDGSNCFFGIVRREDMGIVLELDVKLLVELNGLQQVVYIHVEV